MKKIIALSTMAICFTATVHAQTDTAAKKTTTTTTTTSTTRTAQASTAGAATPAGSTKYFYYPQANVYYNEANGNYSYYDPASSTWTTNQQLPSTISVDKNASKSTVFFSGTDVWTDNAAHQKKYGAQATNTPNTAKP